MDIRILFVCGILIPLIVSQPLPGMGSGSALGRSIDVVKPQLITQTFGMIQNILMTLKFVRLYL